MRYLDAIYTARADKLRKNFFLQKIVRRDILDTSQQVRRLLRQGSIMKTEMTSTQQTDARRTFATLCQALDNIKWKYDADWDKLVVLTSARGEDLSMKLRFVVSEEKKVMYVKSPMPFDSPEGAREIIGKAVNIANFSMLNGCFEYDHTDGWLAFRIVIPFENSILSEEVCRYMIMLTCQMVDRFNDKFLSVAKGNMTLESFEKFANS